MRNPLIDFFKDVARSIRSKNYDAETDEMFRIPMTMPQLDRTILTLEDGEYFRQTTDIFCEQVDEVQKHLDEIEKRAMNLVQFCDNKGELNELQAIIAEVNRIRDFYGRVDGDDDDK